MTVRPSNRELVNLVVFLAALGAGVGLIVAGHAAVGAGLLAFATGHAMPSPLNKTPSLERVEKEEEEQP